MKAHTIFLMSRGLTPFWSRIFLLAGIVFLVCPGTAIAESQPNDQFALTGLSEGKAVFDIRHSNPNKLLGLLTLIGKTADSLVAQGVKPDFILAFRGPASAYLSDDRRLITLDEYKVAGEIAVKVKEMANRSGVRFEQCAVAAKKRKIDHGTILPEVHVVGNTFISLMAYQNRGYAFIPIN